MAAPLIVDVGATLPFEPAGNTEIELLPTLPTKIFCGTGVGDVEVLELLQPANERANAAMLAQHIKCFTKTSLSRRAAIYSKYRRLERGLGAMSR